MVAWATLAGVHIEARPATMTGRTCEALSLRAKLPVTRRGGMPMHAIV
jgi:hypothetical protein